MNLENFFISQFHNSHIGDDAAVIGESIYSKDAFFEGVHYKKEWLSYFQIARKSMLVNISDAIAMNADPKYALLSVAMPSCMNRVDMKELAAGFKSVADEYGVEIIGGDTISNTKLDITVTIVSHTKKPLLRSGVKKGYSFAYTGKLGMSSRELKRLFNLGKIHSKSKFIDIKLQKKFINKSSRLIKSGMDISDGLYSDLQKMSSLNRVGVEFNARISKGIGCSGEEYEMLIAFDKRDTKAILRHAKVCRVKLNIFASAVRNKYTNRCKAHHF